MRRGRDRDNSRQRQDGRVRLRNGPDREVPQAAADFIEIWLFMSVSCCCDEATVRIVYVQEIRPGYMAYCDPDHALSRAGLACPALWMCPKQYLASRIKAAFSRYKARVMPASIVERAVPTASLPPFRPCDVIAVLTVGISRFPGRTKEALDGAAWTGD